MSALKINKNISDLKDEKLSSLDLVLSNFRAKAKSEREKGEIFEVLMKDFFKQSPEHNFQDVFLWRDWEDKKKYKLSNKDLGIDLVATEKNGRIWAIQCKFFEKTTTVNKDHVKDFLSYYSKDIFHAGIFVTTTDLIGDNARKLLQARKGIITLSKSDLDKYEIDWLKLVQKKKQEKYELRDHQVHALKKTKEYFKKENKGKLVMACGAGKTLTALHIAESLTQKNQRILFLAPSISLVSQTLRVWAYQRSQNQKYIVVCSDSQSGKAEDGQSVHDLQIAPTTDAKQINKELKQNYSDSRLVVFSTYQSLEQISKAQKNGAPEFDLVICDEAHRTTGVEGKLFTKIHDEKFLKAKKRLFMTATPKIYTPSVKKKADLNNVEVYSMDDKDKYGKEIYRLDFSKAIDKDLLTDYKVLILHISEDYLNKVDFNALKGTDLNLAEGAKLVGCYKALRDQGDPENGRPLKRALAFLDNIKHSKACKKDFYTIVKALDEHENDNFTCETEHVDGKMDSSERNDKLKWLKEEVPRNEDGEVCRILMNVKCLSEGVDVPSLDAVLFLHPKKSQIDIVQSIGRVIRKSEGKKYGYVILPIVVPKGEKVKDVITENHPNYKQVYTVLNALRSHDNEFDAHINNLRFNENKNIGKIENHFIGFGTKQKFSEDSDAAIKIGLKEDLIEAERNMFVKIVDNCGDRVYEEKWSKEIVEINRTLQVQIESLLKQRKFKDVFDKYHHALKNAINPQIDLKKAIDILSQHIITKPVFDSIFQDYIFSEKNPIAKALSIVIESLNAFGLQNELKSLDGFYKKIQKRMKGIDNPLGKQHVIKELYENFIKKAFPDLAQKLGVAYTPVECIDFMLHSVNDLLKKEFNLSLSSKDLSILEPFSGTGTVINRLISNPDLIKDEDLEHKFSNEIFANELMLLPYYVSSINAEEAYFSRVKKYKSFKGIAFTDTFELQNHKNKNLSLFNENEKIIEKQNNSKIKVIITNPPYSVGQKSENDGNKNEIYPHLRKRLADTYVKDSGTVNKVSLYDSYIQAFRWATDRIGDDKGLICFIHNGQCIKSLSGRGFRKSVEKEFDLIYTLDLRGEAKGSAEYQRKEGKGVFGQSSRTPISITFLLKKDGLKNKKAKVFYHDIGDYLKRDEKLNKLNQFHSLTNIKFKEIKPDKNGDWLNQTDSSFYKFMPLGDKDKSKETVFDLYSSGVLTARDAWAYNFNKKEVSKNMKNMISFYNSELIRLKKEIASKKFNYKTIDKKINRDSQKISWTIPLKKDLLKEKRAQFSESNIKLSSYRPFQKSYLYFNRMFNEGVYQNPQIWKDHVQNKVICVSGKGVKNFSCLMTDAIPDRNFFTVAQCFPLYYFDKDGTKKDGINDLSLNKFRDHYKDKSISKEEIFYYIYGVLHKKDYREKYKNNLSVSIPHIPFYPDFKKIMELGYKLSVLHLNYENQTHPVSILKNDIKVNKKDLKPSDLRVLKMKISNKEIQYNDLIKITNIPEKAWEYMIGDWSCLKWFTERFRLKTNKDSGIVNDPNTYSSDPAYILNTLISLIDVSIQTVGIIEELSEKDLKQSKKAA